MRGGCGEIAQHLLELRPVSFRYEQHAASDPDAPVQHGLIAEEMAEVFPELVVYDKKGRPETAKTPPARAAAAARAAAR